MLTNKPLNGTIKLSKTVNGVTTAYYLNGSQILAEETNGNITLYVYDEYGTKLISYVYGAYGEHGIQYYNSGSTTTATHKTRGF